MKRLLTLALTLLLCCALLIPTAHADVVWEPTENSFYDAHSDECFYQDKTYFVPQDTPAYEAPGDPAPLINLPAGETVYVSFAYTDKTGRTWGAVDNWEDGVWNSAWADLSLLSPIYDTRDFLADHADELTPYEGDPAQLSSDGDWMLWDYPGSQEGWPFTPDEYFDLSWAESVYTDPTGAQWLYFPYIFGCEGWIYVPDPCRTEPISLGFATPEPTAQPTAEPTAQPTVQPTSTPYATSGPGILSRLPALALGLVCIGVLLIAVVTVVLILVFYPRKKK